MTCETTLYEESSSVGSAFRAKKVYLRETARDAPSWWSGAYSLALGYYTLWKVPTASLISDPTP